MKPSPILTESLLRADCRKLSATEPGFARLAQRVGYPQLRHRPPGFAGMFRIIVGQQLSVTAASTIWQRLEQAGLTQPDALKKASDAELQQCGLSQAKRHYARELTRVRFDELDSTENQDIIDYLTSFKGIGLWSAEIYLLFVLKRRDVFPAADLALRRGFALLRAEGEKTTPNRDHKNNSNPNSRSNLPMGSPMGSPMDSPMGSSIGPKIDEAEIRQHAARNWTPRRSAAALMLWHGINMKAVI